MRCLLVYWIHLNWMRNIWESKKRLLLSSETRVRSTCVHSNRLVLLHFNIHMRKSARRTPFPFNYHASQCEVKFNSKRTLLHFGLVWTGWLLLASLLLWIHIVQFVIKMCVYDDFNILIQSCVRTQLTIFENNSKNKSENHIMSEQWPIPSAHFVLGRNWYKNDETKCWMLRVNAQLLNWETILCRRYFMVLIICENFAICFFARIKCFFLWIFKTLFSRTLTRSLSLFPSFGLLCVHLTIPSVTYISQYYLIIDKDSRQTNNRHYICVCVCVCAVDDVWLFTYSKFWCNFGSYHCYSDQYWHIVWHRL